MKRLTIARIVIRARIATIGRTRIRPIRTLLFFNFQDKLAIFDINVFWGEFGWTVREITLDPSRIECTEVVTEAQNKSFRFHAVVIYLHVIQFNFSSLGNVKFVKSSFVEYW